jgi:hypothetical protein
MSAGDGGKQARSPGSAKETLKTIARGMPGDSGVTVVTNARVFYTPRTAAGASGARHSLRPLIGGREISSTTRAHRAAGMRNRVSFVIACDKREAFAQGSTPVRRSPPSGEGGCDEAIHSFLLCGSMDCFASSGAHSRDPLARNDGVGRLKIESQLSSPDIAV